MWLVVLVSMPARTRTSPIGSLFIDQRASPRIYRDLQRTISIKLMDKFISETETKSNNKYDLDMETTSSCSETLLPVGKRCGLALV